MVVIRKGVTKLGSYTMKKVFTKTVSADDDGSMVEQDLAMIKFPHYTHPGYVWCDIDVVGAKTGHDPQNFMELAIRGSLVNVPLNHDAGSYADNWASAMEDLMPIDPTTADAGTNATDVGITGREHVFPGGHEFFRREQLLGLPNSSYPSDAEKMTYKAHFKYKGHARTPLACAVEMPKWMGFGVTATVPYQLDNSSSNANKSLVAAGDYTDNEAHYQALIDNIPSQNNAPPTLGDDDVLPTTLENYLYHGFQDEGTSSPFANADDLHIRMYLTIRLDVYTPTHASYVPSP